MPKVSINIIKEWFKNQSKPPQEHFWAWLESFWHKDEPIPQSAVENLVSTLQKKADLVDGVVPESQLPFSVVTSEVIALGPVSIDGNTVNLPVHSSGANKVRVKGQLITRTFPNQWLFTDIVADGYKVLRGYAVKGEDDFFLAESAELPEIADPEIPENALELFRFTISAAGAVLDQDESNGYKQIAEDPFRNIVITNDSPLTVGIGGSPSSSFNITVSWTSAAPKIAGIRTKFKKNTRDGHEVTFYNDSDKPVTFMPGAYADGGDITDYGFAAEFVLKPGTYQKFKRRNNLYEVMGGGGSAEFPEGNLGDVLVKGVEGWEASDRLTDAENEIDAEVVNRAAADLLEKNERIAADDLKVDKPTTDGTWSLQKLGSVFTWVSGVVQNIANTDLSNLSARIFTQGNTFTWNTAGFFHYLKGLIDRTGNAAYTKVVVVHPTTGEMVTRDFADPQATTLAVQNANSTQKTAMRTALLGTATPANPVLNSTSRSFIPVDQFIYSDLFGINLTMLDPSYIYIIDPNNSDPLTNKILATSFYNKTGNTVTVLWNIPNSIPDGVYPIKIQNAATVQGASSASLRVIRSVNLISPSSWKMFVATNPATGLPYPLLQGSSIANVNAPRLGMGTNYVIDSEAHTKGALAVKSNNFLPAFKDWEIGLKAIKTLTQTGNFFYPIIGVTSLSDSEFIDGGSLNTLSNHIKGNNVGQFRTEGNTLLNFGNNIDHNLVITKNGSNLYMRLYNNEGTQIGYNEWIGTIDDSKDYALWVRLMPEPAGSFSNFAIVFNYDRGVST